MRCSRLCMLLAAAMTMVGCAEQEREAAAVEPVAGEQQAMAGLACAPSPEMPLEGRQSPYDSVAIDVGGGQAKICYGRPSLRGRTMIGGEAVPYDTLWRTGANEPTTLHLNVPATIAGILVQPGSYSLYTVPRAGAEWTLIVNRSTAQWGDEGSYTADVRAQEVGRAQLQAEALDSPVEQFTIRPTDGGLVMEWQTTRVLVPVEPAA
jgi:hypothetical protein